MCPSCFAQTPTIRVAPYLTQGIRDDRREIRGCVSIEFFLVVFQIGKVLLVVLLFFFSFVNLLLFSFFVALWLLSMCMSQSCW
jgi:hypothetical protein